MKAGLCSYSASVQSAELRSSWSEVVAKSSGQAITTETKLKAAVKSAGPENSNKNTYILGAYILGAAHIYFRGPIF